jgi:hypothetical protein
MANHDQLANLTEGEEKRKADKNAHSPPSMTVVWVAMASA